MNIPSFYDHLNSNTKPHDVIVGDGGGSFFYPAQMVTIKHSMRFLVSPYGTMGWAIPAGIGAYFADPSRRVICIVGDGGIQLNIQELQTIRHHQIPLKIFYMNNDGYDTIRKTQDKYCSQRAGESPATGLSFPEIHEIAKAYKIFSCNDIHLAFEVNTPVICEVVID